MNKICIGVPVYNGSKFLRQSLDALLEQSHEDFCAVILNDGSQDESQQIIDEYAKRDERIDAHANSSRSGLIGAWKRVVEISIEKHAAKYFAWYGDHDLVDKDWLKHLVHAMEADESLVCAYAKTMGMHDDGQIGEEMSSRFDSSRLEDWKRVEWSVTRNVGAGDVVYGLFDVDAMRKCSIFRNELFPDRILVSEIQIYGGIRFVEKSLRYRRLMGYTRDKDLTIQRQCRTLFPDGFEKKSPVTSHVSALVREALPTETLKRQEFMRLFHAWLYMSKNSTKFQSYIFSESEDEVDQDPQLRTFLEMSSELNGGNAMIDKYSFNMMSREKLTVKQLRRELNLSRRFWFLSIPYLKLQKAWRLLRRGKKMTREGAKHALWIRNKVEDVKCLSNAISRIERNKAIEQYFSDRGVMLDSRFVSGSDAKIRKQVKSETLEVYDMILVDVDEPCPVTLSQISKAHDFTHILYFAKPTKFFEQLRFYRAKGWREKLKSLKRAIHTLKSDFKISLYSSRVYVWNEWERQNYWKYFCFRNQNRHMPLVKFKKMEPLRHSFSKEKTCLALTGIGNPSMTGKRKRDFVSLVAKIGVQKNEWQFLIGGVEKNGHRDFGRVEYLSEGVDDWKAIRQADLVVVLDDDAIGLESLVYTLVALGRRVLVSKRTLGYLPSELHPYCRSYDSGGGFERILEWAESPLPAYRPDRLMIQRGCRELDEFVMAP